jgi:hypothetical protein
MFWFFRGLKLHHKEKKKGQAVSVLTASRVISHEAVGSLICLCFFVDPHATLSPHPALVLSLLKKL